MLIPSSKESGDAGKNAMRHTTRLRQLVEDEAILVAPGTYDPLMARLIAQAGFQAVEMNGALDRQGNKAEIGTLWFSSTIFRRRGGDPLYDCSYCVACEVTAA